jgi:hypothetical protein
MEIIGTGRLRPAWEVFKIDFRSVYATVLRNWLGVDPGEYSAAILRIWDS